MWGWIGTIVGLAGGIAAAIIVAPAGVAVGIGLITKGIAFAIIGAGAGAAAGKITSFVIKNYEKSLEKEDKKLAAELKSAENDAARLKVAEDALKHSKDVAERQEEEIKKLTIRQEELNNIIKGKKPLPEGMTMEDVKNEFKNNEAQLSEIFRQQKSNATIMEKLTTVIQSGGKPLSEWSLPTGKTIGLIVVLFIGGMILIGILIKAVKKWMGMLF